METTWNNQLIGMIFACKYLGASDASVAFLSVVVVLELQQASFYCCRSDLFVHRKLGIIACASMQLFGFPFRITMWCRIFSRWFECTVVSCNRWNKLLQHVTSIYKCELILIVGLTGYMSSWHDPNQGSTTAGKGRPASSAITSRCRHLRADVIPEEQRP